MRNLYIGNEENLPVHQASVVKNLDFHFHFSIFKCFRYWIFSFKKKVLDVLLHFTFRDQLTDNK